MLKLIDSKTRYVAICEDCEKKGWNPVLGESGGEPLSLLAHGQIWRGHADFFDHNVVVADLETGLTVNEYGKTRKDKLRHTVRYFKNMS